jgi:hypothetical protein
MKRFERVGRRVGILSVTVVAMLVAAGGAFAWHGFGTASIVSATFTANTVSNSQSQTCTAASGDALQITDATFAGTSTSTDANLNGAVTIYARNVYDTTTKAGTVTGLVKIAGSGSAGFEGRLVTVDVNGQLQGMLFGEETSTGAFLGNVSSSFSTATGFGASGSPASLGAGTGANTAIVSASSCQSDAGDNDQDDDNGQGKSGGHDEGNGPGHLPSFGKFFRGSHHGRH